MLCYVYVVRATLQPRFMGRNACLRMCVCLRVFFCCLFVGVCEGMSVCV